MPPKSQEKAAAAASKHPSARRRLDLDRKSPPPREHASSDVVDLTADSPKKRGMDSFFAKKTESAFQTPPNATKRDRDDEPPAKRSRVAKEDEYVPTYIHKNVEYRRKGKAELSDETLATFKLVEKYYVIPEDFETSRKYGPLSGLSFEERAISAYSLGLLDPKTAESANVAICSVCAVEGHKRSDCPTLI